MDKNALLRDARAYLFLAPALIVLFLFSFWPVGLGALLAFTKVDIFNLTASQWVGLENFRNLFDDPVFIGSIRNTLLYLLVVPLIQVAALALAVLVNSQLPAIRLFRTAFFVPVVTSVSVVGIMWGWMYNEDGMLNQALAWLRLIDAPVGWLSDERFALFSVMFVTFWRGLGYYMVLYLAGLQAMPQEVEEAALLDGANRWQRFWRITVPMLRPTILLCTLLSTLAAMKAFEEVVVMTGGGPIGSTYTLAFYAYDMGFRAFDFSRALAASLVVSLIGFVLAWFNFRFFRPDAR
ncbi:lactose ABC transporter permease [Chitiniphilus shinanonensis]|uniref:Lactose ABC transporter permease n=1 Tax=Chitiniphilus shinanonensis TaxID=553088 RepID=A0ABQ6BQC2_9NEIS|nr:sugar ABC transporter permease [Chitiniphilus shinanonensis]GLS04178.1 lactose ABC transporter permease [Chitiniphilus shinanonensis]